LIDRLLGNARFAIGLYGFMRNPTSLAAARASIRRQLAERETSFLDVMKRAVYARPDSPYLRLLRHAGIGLGDLEAMVASYGLRATLQSLYDGGVYLTHEEFSGRRPVQRGSLRFEVKVSDFDNPLLTAFSAVQSSGSRSAGTRVYIDLSMMEGEAEHIICFMDAHGALGRPIAIWSPAPPLTQGLNNFFRYSRIGARPEAWFSQTKIPWTPAGARAAAYIAYSSLLTRLAGRPLPMPRYTPRTEGIRVARWLGRQRRAGRPGLVDCSVSSATRVCLAAREAGLDIAGSMFRTGGEPLTEAKEAIIAAAGCHVIDRYQMTETGVIALGCAARDEVDDMHVVLDKFEVLQRDKVVGAAGETVPALVYTTLRPNCRAIMLNAESGDYGTLSQRHCGCPLDELGYSLHLSGVRAYDKLTSEGVTACWTKPCPRASAATPRTTSWWRRKSMAPPESVSWLRLRSAPSMSPRSSIRCCGSSGAITSPGRPWRSSGARAGRCAWSAASHTPRVTARSSPFTC
jgi:hypothetical protein